MHCDSDSLGCLEFLYCLVEVLIAKKLLWGTGTVSLRTKYFPPSILIGLYHLVGERRQPVTEIPRAKERRKGSLWGLMSSCAGFPMYRCPLAGHTLHW